MILADLDIIKADIAELRKEVDSLIKAVRLLETPPSPCNPATPQASK